MKANYRDRAAIGLIEDTNSASRHVAGRARARLLNFDAYIAEQFPRWLERQIEGNSIQSNGDGRPPSPEIKLIRAHLKGLVRLHLSYTKRPPDWAMKSLRLKNRDGLACSRCKNPLPPDELHAHHIVFRSRSGANNATNLVVLCIPCHQLQHDHPISQWGGEPEGVDESEDGLFLEIYDIAPNPALPVEIELPQVLALPVAPVSTPPATSPPRIRPLQLARNPLSHRREVRLPPVATQLAPQLMSLRQDKDSEAEYSAWTVLLDLVNVLSLVFGMLLIIGAAVLLLVAR
ncbi:MAG: HNH endonuclease [Dokdonella sp.]|nr:HNH endonuclease [Dokdonella sp.]